MLDYDSDGNTTEITRSFYHRNALGSVMEITDMNQAEVVSYRYDPYGKVTITRGGTPQSSDPLGNHWTFTGRFLDEDSGLLYYRARYYDPATGRFLQRDALGYVENPNLFAYAASNAINYDDPSGTTAVAFPDPLAIPYTPGLTLPWGRWLHNGHSVTLAQSIWTDLESMREIIEDIFGPDENPIETCDPNGGPTITGRQLREILESIDRQEAALRSVLWDPYAWKKVGSAEDDDRKDTINDADNYVSQDEDYQQADSMFR